MSTNTENPPAFPYAFHFPDADGVPQGINLGMTLRDYFAVRANEGDISAHQDWPLPTYGGTSESPRYTREQARYRYADAMLKARGTP